VEVSEVLQKAWTAVGEAGLPEQIQETAFREAIRMLIPGIGAAADLPRVRRIEGNGGSMVIGSDGNSSNAGDGVTVSEDEMYAKVVAQTEVDQAKLEDLVHMDDDGPHVSIPGLKLGRSNADRTRAVAQILTIVRGFGLGESGTLLDVIRAECERLKVYDQTNFARQVRALDGYVITGAGPNRRLRAKGPGIAAFSNLVDSLPGASG
jgi:hypothetical protein